MYGAILGDMIGSPYEFDESEKIKDFEMFNPQVVFTDDSTMTIAVADAFMSVPNNAGEDELKAAFVESMRRWGRKWF